MPAKYYIKTFGCQMNEADSERLEKKLLAQGKTPAQQISRADEIYINSCMVRESAENRVFGLIENLKDLTTDPRIILTGCMVGLMKRDLSGRINREYRKKLARVDQFSPIEELVPDNQDREGCPAIQNIRSATKTHGLVPISNGCSHHCSYCIVPFCRGREESRPFCRILEECQELLDSGYSQVTLLGQNVNSYYFVSSEKGEPWRFDKLLKSVARLGFKKASFMSANPWNFPEKLIDVIAENNNISREIHLPLQSGDDEILQRMNRPYNVQQYVDLVSKIRAAIPEALLSTDIIVGFPGETREQFKNTVKVVEGIGFEKAYIARYSPRPRTRAAKQFTDNVSAQEKRRRWRILDEMINHHHNWRPND